MADTFPWQQGVLNSVKEIMLFWFNIVVEIF